MYPSIRYTGRLSGDALGSMTISETSIIAGGGAQTGTNRWGDYSCLSIDPTDDYTFWYTQEYIKSTGSAPWRTRIASFQFGAAPVADTWTGGINQDWWTGANWGDGTVPTRADKVVIDGAVTPPNWPFIPNNLDIGHNVGDVSLMNNAFLSIGGDLRIKKGNLLQANSADSIEIVRNFIGEGAFASGSSSVSFSGINDVVIEKMPSTTKSGNSTLFSATNLGKSAYFDFTNNSTGAITINSFDVNLNTTGSATIEIWYCQSGSYQGNQNNPGNWTQLGTAQTVVGTGVNYPTHVTPSTTLMIPVGATYGLFISAYDGGGNSQLLVTSISSVTAYSNTSSSIICGDAASSAQPGFGSTANYAWNGTVYYSYTDYFPRSFYNLYVNKNNAVVNTNTDINIQNNFTINPKGMFSLMNQLTVQGNSYFNADSTGIFSFLDQGVYSANQTYYQQYLTPDRWHIISPPVACVTNVYLGDYIYRWSEPDSSFENIVSTIFPLAIDTGYFTYVSNIADTITFSGTPNKTDIPLQLLYSTGSGKGKGWNLLGNPFPSYLNFDKSINWGLNNVDSTIYFYDAASSQYVNWNISLGLGTATSGAIPPTQGFWLKANNTGATATLPAAGRIHSTQNFYKNNTVPNIKFSLKNEEYSGNIIVALHPEASFDFDNRFDAYFLEASPDIPQLYIYDGENKLAMNTIPNTDCIIPVHLSVNTTSILTFSIQNICSPNDFSEVYLHDLKTNLYTNLTEASYVFTASPNDDLHRFDIYFANPTKTEEIEVSTIHIFGFEHSVYIQTPDANGQVTITDMLGKCIYSSSISDNISVIDLKETGYFIVKYLNQNEVIRQKVYIH
jgi:hypothetical protein